MNEQVLVVQIAHGVVNHIEAFHQFNSDKAEKEFERIAVKMGCLDDDLEDAVTDGYYESETDHKSVCITWLNIPQPKSY
jgi:pyoverdine/dityrosine biosynthesis protein Dit1